MDLELVAAFQAAPRSFFLPPNQKRFAKVDAPLPIGFGVTNSQPTTVADMLTLLEVQGGQRVLDVGSGSGWTSALLAELVGPSGSVLAVERVPELVSRSREVLEGWPNVEVFEATPGVFGLPEQGPFDRILVSAMADEIPQDLVNQLKPGGLMVVPVASRMLRVVREASGNVAVTSHGLYSFVPLLP